MNGQNYLIPIDAKMKSESTAQFEAVPLEQVLGGRAKASGVRCNNGCIAGYASAKYLAEDFVDPPDQKLNIRAGPGKQYAAVAEPDADTTSVLVTDCQVIEGYDCRWCNLSWNDVSGWAYGRYLQDNRGQKPEN